MRPWLPPVLFILLFGCALAFGAGIYREHVLQQQVVAQAAALGGRLAAYSQQLEATAHAMGRQIGYAVYQNRNQRRDVEVQRQAEQIIRRADSLADSLAALLPLQPTASAGKLTELAQHLDRYAAFIRQYAPAAPALTHPGGALPQASDFGSYYFLELPAASARANMARLLAEVRRFEVDALSVQAQKVGSRCICFDKIGAVALPASGTVAPGGIYEAQLLLAQSFSEFSNQQMHVNGRPIRKFEVGQGLVEIAIPPSFGPRADTLRAEWHGTIRAALYPADTTWQLTVPYLIINKLKR